MKIEIETYTQKHPMGDVVVLRFLHPTNPDLSPAVAFRRDVEDTDDFYRVITDACLSISTLIKHPPAF